MVVWELVLSLLALVLPVHSLAIQGINYRVLLELALLVS